MGLNITLFIDKELTAQEGYFLGGGSLEVHRDVMVGLVDRGAKLFPKKIKFTHPELGHVQVDGMGSPLQYVTAGQLSKIKPPDGTCDWNKAIINFMKSIDPKTWVILYWW